MRSPAAAALVLLLTAGAAHADVKDDDKLTCVVASEEAQQLRSDGKIRAARAKLLICAREACPGIVKKDCTEWLVDLDRTMPSIVPAVRDASGKDVATARVYIDGQLVAEHLDGRAIPMDPGAHAVKVEAGGISREEHVVLREGERNRVVVVTLAREPALGQVSPPSPDRAGPPALAYVMGGVALLGVAGFAGFGLVGRAEVDDMRSTCAPGCSAGDVDAARTKLIVADASLAVGVVAVGLATWLFLKPRGDARSPTVSVLRF